MFEIVMHLSPRGLQTVPVRLPHRHSCCGNAEPLKWLGGTPSTCCRHVGQDGRLELGRG